MGHDEVEEVDSEGTCPALDHLQHIENLGAGLTMAMGHGVAWLDGVHASQDKQKQVSETTPSQSPEDHVELQKGLAADVVVRPGDVEDDLDQEHVQEQQGQPDPSDRYFRPIVRLFCFCGERGWKPVIFILVAIQGLAASRKP